jgi:hypothetical protein
VLEACLASIADIWVLMTVKGRIQPLNDWHHFHGVDWIVKDHLLNTNRLPFDKVNKAKGAEYRL